MTTSKKASTELSAVEQRIKDRLANVENSTQQSTGNNISVKGSTFRLPSGATSQGPLNCIVLDYVNKNMHYPDTYVEGEFSEPTCYAIGRNIKDMVPSEAITAPINSHCHDCELNQFGSKGRGKACSNNVLLAVLPDDFTEDSEVLTIKVAAKGLKGWANYVRELKALNVDPAQVVTSLSFAPGLAYPCLTFKHIGGNERLDEVGPFLVKADLLLSA